MKEDIVNSAKNNGVWVIRMMMKAVCVMFWGDAVNTFIKF